MNAKAALCMALLEGRILNVYNCMTEVGLSNVSREIPRLIEKPFSVIVSRVKLSSKNRYGDDVYYTNYRLNRKIPGNLEGMLKMAQYVREQMGELADKRTEKEVKQYKQIDLFLNSL